MVLEKVQVKAERMVVLLEHEKVQQKVGLLV